MAVVFVSQSYNYTHLSAGDLLRAERAREGSECGQLIAAYIKEGKIVPVEITINLLKKVCTEYRLKIRSVIEEGPELSEFYSACINQGRSFNTLQK